jgi:hypothetical protein
MFSIIKMCLISFLIFTTISMASLTTITYAQTATPAAGAESKIDESNTILSGCKLSVLSTSPSQDITPGAKQKFISGCIQSIIRFVIVIASLAAILRIAVSGVALLDPSGGLKGSKGVNSAKSIQNLIIGLFLLTVGWNLVGILNATFNNADFLNLPTVDQCKVANGCETPAQKTARITRQAITTYNTAVKENKYSGSNTDEVNTINAIKEFCAKKGDAKLKDTYAGIDDAVCKEDYAAKLGKIAQNGANNPDTFVAKYNAEVEKYRKLKQSGKTGTDLITQESEIGALCQTIQFQNSTTPEGQAIFKTCQQAFKEGDTSKCKIAGELDKKCVQPIYDDDNARRAAYFASIK